MTDSEDDVRGDNIIRRKDKAAWGFTAGPDGQIRLGVPAPADTEDLRDAGLETTDSEEARGNGGGFPAEDEITYEYLHSLKKEDLLKLAADHEITLDKPKGTKDEILAELDAYYEVEAAK